MAEVLTQLNEMLPTSEESGCLHLSYGERIIGFGITTVCAILAGILSILALFILNLRKFSVLFTVSTVLFMVAIMLLAGFKRVMKSCTDKKRAIASGGLILGMAITLFFGLCKRQIILAIVGFALEIVSYLYFVLSFIPGGERFFHLILF